MADVWPKAADRVAKLPNLREATVPLPKDTAPVVRLQITEARKRLLRVLLHAVPQRPKVLIAAVAVRRKVPDVFIRSHSSQHNRKAQAAVAAPRIRNLPILIVSIVNRILIRLRNTRLPSGIAALEAMVVVPAVRLVRPRHHRHAAAEILLSRRLHEVVLLPPEAAVAGLRAAPVDAKIFIILLSKSLLATLPKGIFCVVIRLLTC